MENLARTGDSSKKGDEGRIHTDEPAAVLREAIRKKHKNYTSTEKKWPEEQKDRIKERVRRTNVSEPCVKTGQGDLLKICKNSHKKK